MSVCCIDGSGREKSAFYQEEYMFRNEEIIAGGWGEKTIEAMQRRRFELTVASLLPLSTQRLHALTPIELKRRIECSWQEIEMKPMRSLQLSEIRKRVVSAIELHADCLSREEHNLVERALILGGCAQIEDMQELEAAQALSLRLWASVGIVEGKPCIELERCVMQPAAVAIARDEHERIRERFEAFSAGLSAHLYRAGAIDDRVPQQMILRDVLGGMKDEPRAKQLARRYLWASYDCMDYADGVMLLHPALAEPRRLLNMGKRMSRYVPDGELKNRAYIDILPEEIPLQTTLERTITGALRDGLSAQDVARDIRFLCKQGAPFDALVQVLQSSLIVYVSEPMRYALQNMFYMTPKWIENAKSHASQ